MPIYPKREQVYNTERALNGDEQKFVIKFDRAIQWRGDNIEEVLSFTSQGEIVYGSDVKAQKEQGISDEPAMAIFITGIPKKKVEVGDWIILGITDRASGYLYYTCPDVLFRASHDTEDVMRSFPDDVVTKQIVREFKDGTADLIME